MTSLRYCLLTEPERPLLNKFYKDQGSSMRAAAQGQLWVVRAEEIVAALCLTPVTGGYWLTGLWVAERLETATDCQRLDKRCGKAH